MIKSCPDIKLWIIDLYIIMRIFTGLSLVEISAYVRWRHIMVWYKSHPHVTCTNALFFDLMPNLREIGTGIIIKNSIYSCAIDLRSYYIYQIEIFHISFCLKQSAIHYLRLCFNSFSEIKWDINYFVILTINNFCVVFLELWRIWKSFRTHLIVHLEVLWTLKQNAMFGRMTVFTIGRRRSSQLKNLINFVTIKKKKFSLVWPQLMSK